MSCLSCLFLQKARAKGKVWWNTSQIWWVVFGCSCWILGLCCNCLHLLAFVYTLWLWFTLEMLMKRKFNETLFQKWQLCACAVIFDYLRHVHKVFPYTMSCRTITSKNCLLLLVPNSHWLALGLPKFKFIFLLYWSFFIAAKLMHWNTQDNQVILVLTVVTQGSSCINVYLTRLHHNKGTGAKVHFANISQVK